MTVPVGVDIGLERDALVDGAVAVVVEAITQLVGIGVAGGVVVVAISGVIRAVSVGVALLWAAPDSRYEEK